MTTFSRVFNAQHNMCLQAKKIRNIGIIAHIDAGKTTVTERFLYLAGVTRTIGDVDSGNTVTDFLEIERERGITVQSTAVSFKWNNSVVNLIDTPGHVDFTLEVERCTRVLDGVVTILDSKAGVQAQTRKVWKQASKFTLPSVFFINKMDKPGSNVERVLNSLEEKLNVKGILTVYPLYKSGELYGFIDILSERSLKLGDEGWKNIEKCFLNDFHGRKEELCFQLADADSSFSTQLLDLHNGDCSKISSEDLYKALHFMISSNAGSVVSCGSALRFPQSVLPLMDQISHFLPTTEIVEKRVAETFGSNLSALVFKIGYEKRKRQLSYLRLYTGSLRSGAMVYNVNRGETDGPIRTFVPNGDELVPISTVKAGDIAVVSGLKNTRTGDTLTSTEKTLINFSPEENNVHLRKEGDHVCFFGIEVPDPVYFCSVEPPSSSAIHDFEMALKEMCAEDPSIRVRQDKDSGQTIIGTMGELHLEIIKAKFTREYGLNVFIGPLQIAYREVVSRTVEHMATVSDEQGDSGRTHKATLSFLLEPRKCGPFKKITVDLPSGSPPVRHEWQKAISEGCSNALHNGPILGFPVKDVQINLKHISVSGGRINPAILSACAHKCVTEALCSPNVAELLEPVMRVEIALEGVVDTQTLLQELTKRRAHIEQCELTTDQNSKIVARMPLSEMAGLATVVRILTSGLGSLSYFVDEYAAVNDHDKSAILSKLKAF